MESAWDAVRKRQKEERKELERRAEKLRSFVPKKDRVGRQRTNEEIEELRKQLSDRHKKELEEAGLSADADPGEEGIEEPAGLDESVEAHGIYQGKKLSKQQRRRQLKEQALREEDRRKKLEKAQAGPTEQALELEAMRELLRPEQLKIYDIRADGDCLFSAIAHQLDLLGEKQTAASLREMAADHLLSRQTEYIYFVEGIEGDESNYANYCESIRSTKTWGGQVELRALARELKVRILVFAADLPLLTIGDDEDSARTVRLAFHRKYCSLGDHYNSVVPA